MIAETSLSSCDDEISSSGAIYTAERRKKTLRFTPHGSRCYRNYEISPPPFPSPPPLADGNRERAMILCGSFRFFELTSRGISCSIARFKFRKIHRNLCYSFWSNNDSLYSERVRESLILTEMYLPEQVFEEGEHSADLTNSSSSRVRRKQR